MKTTTRSLVLLIACLCLLGWNEEEKRPSNHQTIQGHWGIDVDKMIALDPKLSAQVKANPAQRVALAKAMGQARFTIGPGSISLTMNGTEERATYTVKSDRGKTLVIASKDEGESEIEILKATFSGPNAMLLEKEGDAEKIPVVRVPSNHERIQGTWTINVEKLIELDPRAKQEIAGNPQAKAMMVKMLGSATFTFTAKGIDATIGGKSERATYKVQLDSGNLLVIESQDVGATEVEAIKVVFGGDDSLIMSKRGESERIPLTRAR
ncbi:MAG: archaellum component FlaG (FlaF/FlaG flagellin family) [Myxococcota bacterium]